MLVLSRKQSQDLIIGRDIRIRVTQITANRVTLAIDAPKSVSILRGELEQRPEAEKEAG